MHDLLRAVVLFASGWAAIYCGLTAWYLTTPAGRLYWNKLQRVRARQKVIRDWLDGKDQA